uniref:Uncharacterized protein n=1 Tax=Bionectria ochroleuca TaxID=29856 RepID=A0A8H7MYT6_BIOOC
MSAIDGRNLLDLTSNSFILRRKLNHNMNSAILDAATLQPIRIPDRAMWLQLLLLSPLLYVAWNIISLRRNIAKCRSMGVPVVWVPIDHRNFFWLLIQGYVWDFIDSYNRPWSSIPTYIRFTRPGWQFYDKGDTHVKLGPVWALVTPANTFINVSDPKAIEAMVNHRKDSVSQAEQPSKHCH